MDSRFIIRRNYLPPHKIMYDNMTYDNLSMTKCLYDNVTQCGILLTKNIQLNKLSTFIHTKYKLKWII